MTDAKEKHTNFFIAIENSTFGTRALCKTTLDDQVVHHAIQISLISKVSR
jgi:hypothetical protein